MNRRNVFSLLLGLLLIVSAITRFTNLNWDAGHQIHPDELVIVNGAMKIRFFTDLNPGFYDYNGLSVYLLRATALAVSRITGDPSYSTTQQGMTIVGRYISAAASTLSVGLIYLLALQFFQPLLSVACATVFAFSPILIQLAHYCTVDTLLVMALTFLILSCQYYRNKTTTRNVILMALSLASALAIKNTAYLFFPLPVLTILLSNRLLSDKIRDMLLLVICTCIGFFLLSLCSFLGFAAYIQNLGLLENIMLSGVVLYDWTTQFIHTTPLFWFIQTIPAFGPMAIVGPLGLVLILFDWIRNKTHRCASLSIVSMWTAGFAITLSLAYVKFIRYNAPLAVGYALGFSYMFTTYKRSSFVRILLIICISIQVLWGIMFFSIYLTPHTTVRAASWMATAIPDNSTILNEYWNSIIRYNLPPLSNKQLRLVPFNLYTRPDSAEKMRSLADILATVDYVVLDSPKVRNTIVRHSDLYPLSERFYVLLETKKLGFTLENEISSYPRIGPLEINDEGAEETFYIFDHPTVKIYRNTLHFSSQTIETMLDQNNRTR